MIDAAFARYIAYAKEKNISLADVGAFFDWVDTDYDPAEVKASFHSKGWGDLLTEVILRRE